MRDTFFKYLQFEKRYSSHTLVSYQNDLDQFSKYLEDQFQTCDLLKAEHRHIRSWVVNLMQDGVKPRSINRKIIALRSFYKFAISREAIHQNPTQKIKALKSAKELPQFVQEKEMDNLLSHIVFPEDFEGNRDALIMELLYGTGMRLAELIGLKEDDFNRQAGTIRILGKGNKERVVPFHLEIGRRLDKYIFHKKNCFRTTGRAL